MTELLSVPSLALAAGLTQVAMAAACLALLHGRGERRGLWPWTLSALCQGLWMGLVAMRGLLPDALTYAAANALACAGLLLAHEALQLERGRRAQPMRALGLWLAFLGTHHLLHAVLGLPAWRYTFGLLVLCAGALANGRLAWLTARQWRARSGRWLAIIQWTWAGLLMLRLAAGDVLELAPEALSPHPWNLAVLLGAGLFGGLSHLGYIGMVLDHLAAREARAEAQRATEAQRREDAERHTAQLREALSQLDTLAREREQLLDVLAHEIRQPLHRATGALLAAGAALHAPRDAQATSAVAERLQAAETVLGELRSVLDNTLAAAQILTRRDAVTLQDVDLPMLLELVLGDLPPEQRARVDTVSRTRLRSLEAEPGLVRLALRNLLRNAFLHGDDGQGSVTIEVEEHEAPAGLVLTVSDQGRGLTASHWAHLEDPGTRLKPFARRRGQGLGLSVVRQIMALHGGSLEMGAGYPQGLRASLVFPFPEARPALRPGATGP